MKENCPKKESLDSDEHTSRIGNTLLSSFRKYKPMDTHEESICCLVKYEIRESYFNGIVLIVLEIFLSRNLVERRK